MPPLRANFLVIGPIHPREIVRKLHDSRVSIPLQQRNCEDFPPTEATHSLRVPKRDPQLHRLQLLSLQALLGARKLTELDGPQLHARFSDEPAAPPQLTPGSASSKLARGARHGIGTPTLQGPDPPALHTHTRGVRHVFPRGAIDEHVRRTRRLLPIIPHPRPAQERLHQRCGERSDR